MKALRNIIRLLPLIICIHSSYYNILHAQELSREEARMIAEKNGYTTIRESNLRALNQKNEDYYTFYQNNGAYVVVAGDKRMPEIITYSTSKAKFDESKLAPQAKFIFERYRQMLAIAKEQNISFKDNENTTRSATAYKQVGPLLKTVWDQDTPFNDFAPQYKRKHEDGSIEVGRYTIGCVPLAIAMIMKYYEYPKRPNLDLITEGGKRPPILVRKGWKDWTQPELGKQDLVVDISNREYKYHLMRDNYKTKDIVNIDPDVTQEEKDAVAELCYDIAIFCNANFGADGRYDGYSTPAGISQDLRKFGYITYGITGNASQENYFYEIKEQIDNKRPMLIAGHQKGVGIHLFVLDGYDTNNFVHCNFGWGGITNNNDWYNINYIDPNKGFRLSGNSLHGMNDRDVSLSTLFINALVPDTIDMGIKYKYTANYEFPTNSRMDLIKRYGKFNPSKNDSLIIKTKRINNITEKLKEKWQEDYKKGQEYLLLAKGDEIKYISLGRFAEKIMLQSDVLAKSIEDFEDGEYKVYTAYKENDNSEFQVLDVNNDEKFILAKQNEKISFNKEISNYHLQDLRLVNKKNLKVKKNSLHNSFFQIENHSKYAPFASGTIFLNILDSKGDSIANIPLNRTVINYRSEIILRSKFTIPDKIAPGKYKYNLLYISSYKESLPDDDDKKEYVKCILSDDNEDATIEILDEVPGPNNPAENIYATAIMLSGRFQEIDAFSNLITGNFKIREGDWLSVEVRMANSYKDNFKQYSTKAALKFTNINDDKDVSIYNPYHNNMTFYNKNKKRDIHEYAAYYSINLSELDKPLKAGHTYKVEPLLMIGRYGEPDRNKYRKYFFERYENINNELDTPATLTIMPSNYSDEEHIRDNVVKVRFLDDTNENYPKTNFIDITDKYIKAEKEYNEELAKLVEERKKKEEENANNTSISNIEKDAKSIIIYDGGHKLSVIDKNIYQIIIYDLYANPILNYMIKNDDNISLYDLNKGVYIIKAISSKKVITQKFIIE